MTNIVLPNGQSPADLIPAVLKIARDAGAVILQIYGEEDFGVEHKADDSPLTRADLAANRCIVDGLEALDIGIPVLTEEAADISWEERQQWTSYWLVDPLDGTKEFIKRNGEFTVNIALIHNHEPVAGVVFAPVLDKAWVGSEAGAVVEVGGEMPKAIRANTRPAAAIKVVGSRSHQSTEFAGYLQKLGEHELVSMGSSIKICLIAEGAADLYPRLGLTCEWDTAAAHAVVLAAGGQLTDTNMQPLRYNLKAEYLNPQFFVFGEPRDWSQYLPE